jgi:hypothetical protein
MSTPPGKPPNPIDPHKAHASQNGLARLTHQSKHTSVLVRNIILSRMTAIRFGRRTRRSKRVHNAHGVAWQQPNHLSIGDRSSGLLSLPIAEFESDQPGILNSPAVSALAGTQGRMNPAGRVAHATS